MPHFSLCDNEHWDSSFIILIPVLFWIFIEYCILSGRIDVQFIQHFKVTKSLVPVPAIPSVSWLANCFPVHPSPPCSCSVWYQSAVSASCSTSYTQLEGANEEKCTPDFCRLISCTWKMNLLATKERLFLEKLHTSRSTLWELQPFVLAACFPTLKNNRWRHSIVLGLKMGHGGGLLSVWFFLPQ